MIKTINDYDFRAAFADCGRGDSFSSEALGAIFEYLEEFEDIDLDPIAIDCEYCEYTSLEEFQGDYSAEEYPDMDSVRDATAVIEWGAAAFVIVSF